MPDRDSLSDAVPHRRGCLPVLRFLPFRYQNCIFAAFTDANPSASGVPVKRWFLAILPCMRTATRTAKFLRYRFALLTFPPLRTRLGICIGRDHAACQR